jgi:signal transduction histidine kinase/DNA-binding response OmpR family regulator/ligand-binding sensor domain-containing protein
MRWVSLYIVLLLTILCVKAQTGIDPKVAPAISIDFSFFNNSTIYGIADGMSDPSVSDIVEDKNGYLWLTTNNGISRFDGSHFLNFNYSLTDSTKTPFGFSRSMVFDNTGDSIWFVSNAGIFCSSLQNINFRNVDFISNIIKGVYVLDLLVDVNDCIWIGLHDRGLIYFNYREKKIKEFVFHHDKEGEIEIINNINVILQDDLDSNILWLGSTRGLIRFNISTEEYDVFEAEQRENLDPNLVKVLKTKNDKVYIGAWTSGLSIFNKATLQYDTTFYLGVPRDIFIENEQYLWCSTGTNLFLINTTTNEIEQSQLNNIEKEVLRGLSFIDSRGILWYKWGRGLIKYDPLNSQSYFIALEKKNVFQNPMLVREIIKWNNYYFVAGHNTKGLYKINQEDYTYELIRIPSLENEEGYCSLRDMILMEDKNILIVSASKIVIFNPNTNKSWVSPIQINFAEPSIQALERDNANNYWIGTRRAGLYRLNYEENSIVNYRKEFNTYDERNYFWIQGLFVDSDNKLWIDSGTLSVMDLEDYSLRSLPKSESITYYPDIGNFVETTTGEIWLAGYRQGIGSISYENFEDGITQKKAGYFSCLFRFNDSTLFVLNNDLRQLNINDMSLLNYNIEHNDVKLNGPLILGKNDDLLIGGNNGVFVYNLSQQSSNKEVPQPYISELRVDGKPLYRGEDLSVRNFELTHDTKTINLTLSSLGFHYPGRTTYAYKIEKEWVNLGRGEHINLSNLEPGKFAIELKACDNQGICSTEMVRYKILIRAPWYASSTAYLIYSILFLGLLYSVYKFQLSRKLAFLESKRLKELDRIRTTLYTNITHEFRTPLTVIHGLSETVKSNILKKEKEKTEYSLNLIQKNSEDLLRLVNELLGLSKIESGNMKLQSQQGDIIPFIKYLGESFHSLAQTKSINLVVYTEVDSLCMDFDAYKVSTIVSNLLSNAIKFTPEHGKIVIHLNQVLENSIDIFRIKVTDSGIGVELSKIDNIFDRYYQIDSSSVRGQEGTGIGLTYTKELVKLMGGRISLKSALGKGSTFIVDLPITNIAKMNDDLKMPNDNFSLSTVAEVKQVHTNGNQIFDQLPVALIVEDNPDVSYYLQACLEGRYHTVHASNGKIGIGKAIEIVPDIILSDVMMPEKDGLELCLELKSNDLTDHIPIILLTAKVDVEDRIKGLSHGADGYLAKPFVKEELLVRLDQLVLQRKKLAKKYKRGELEGKGSDSEVQNNSIFLENAIAIVKDSMSENAFATAQLSQKLRLSESQVYRKIKAMTNLSTAVFIRSIRLQKGKELIQQTDKSISEIAYSVGFKDPTYFSRSFKEEFGYSPSELR